MQQRANFDMSNVKGYKSSTFGNIDYITNNEINYNSSNINKYDDVEEVDYSDDSFNGLTTEDILKEKIKWKKMQNEISNQNNVQPNDEIYYLVRDYLPSDFPYDKESVYNDERIIELLRNIDIANTMLFQASNEAEKCTIVTGLSINLPYLCSLKDKDFGVSLNLFPACLLDSSMDLGGNYDIIASLLVQLGFENTEIGIETFKKHVESGKYARLMIETSGISFEDYWLKSLSAFLENLYYKGVFYSFDGFFDADNYDLDDNFFEVVWDTLPGKLDIEDRELIYYAEYLSECVEPTMTYEKFKDEVKNAYKNGNYKEYRDRIIAEGRRKVISTATINGGGFVSLDYDKIKVSYEKIVKDYLCGKISDEEFKLKVLQLVDNDLHIPTCYKIGDPTYNEYSKYIALPEKKDFEENFYWYATDVINEIDIEPYKQEAYIQSALAVMYEDYLEECKIQIYLDPNDFTELSLATTNERKEILDECLNFLVDSDKISGDLLKYLDDYLKEMTEEEKKILTYFYNKDEYGIEKASEYLYGKIEDLNEMIGLSFAEDFINLLNLPKDKDGNVKSLLDYTAEEWVKMGLSELFCPFSDFKILVAQGTTDGIDTFIDGIRNWWNADGISDPNDYKKMYIALLLDSNSFYGTTYDVSMGVGAMTIPVVMSLLVTAITKSPSVASIIAEKIGGAAYLSIVQYAGSLTAAGLNMASSGGNAYEQGLKMGFEEKKAIAYGLFTGLSEAALDAYLGGIQALSFLDNIPGIKGFFISSLKEGGQEIAQLYANNFIDLMFTGELREISWEEIWETGITSMIVGGVLNGGTILLSNGLSLALGEVDMDAVVKLVEAEKLGIDFEITEEILTDPIKAEEVLNQAMENSTGADVTQTNLYSIAYDIQNGNKYDISSLSDVELSQLYDILKSYGCFSQLYDILVDKNFFAGIPVSKDLFINNVDVFLKSDLGYFYNTPNPGADFKNMKPLEQLNKYNALINQGLSQSEALSEMYNDYLNNFVPDWAKNSFYDNLQKSYDNLKKYDSDLTWEEFLMFQLQIIPYNPAIQIPNTYAAWQQAINDSSEMSCFWGFGSIASLLNINGLNGYNNYNNGIGREAYGPYDDATFLLPGSVCQIPSDFSTWDKNDRMNWVGNEVQLDTYDFQDCLFKIDIDMSLFPNGSLVPSNSHHLGANGAWSATMTPAGSNTFEAVGPRIDGVIEYIDPEVQKKIDMAIIGNDKTGLLEIFGEAVLCDPPKIKFIEGITVTRLY